MLSTENTFSVTPLGRSWRGVRAEQTGTGVWGVNGGRAAFRVCWLRSGLRQRGRRGIIGPFCDAGRT